MGGVQLNSAHGRSSVAQAPAGTWIFPTFACRDGLLLAGHYSRRMQRLAAMNIHEYS